MLCIAKKRILTDFSPDLRMPACPEKQKKFSNPAEFSSLNKPVSGGYPQKNPYIRPEK